MPLFYFVKSLSYTNDEEPTQPFITYEIEAKSHEDLKNKILGTDYIFIEMFEPVYFSPREEWRCRVEPTIQKLKELSDEYGYQAFVADYYKNKDLFEGSISFKRIPVVPELRFFGEDIQSLEVEGNKEGVVCVGIIRF